MSIVFKQSCLFGNKRKLKALNKINNSEQFLELIKDCAENKNSWKDNDTLVLRIGVGVKRHSDLSLSCDDVKETGILTLE